MTESAGCVVPPVDVVLVRPSRAANVGAACRAMKNMGLSSLRLVGAPWMRADAHARTLAYGAWDVLEAAELHPTLADAVSGASFVAGTSGRPVTGAWPPRRLAEEGLRRAGSGRMSLVFGPEASGLRNDELRLCHETVRIPTDPAQPSLNLAQSVLLLTYEIRLAGCGWRVPAGEAPATSRELEAALDSLALGLLGIGYLNPQNPVAILAELRRFLARAGPSPREVALLRGMGRQLQWAARFISRQRGGG